MAKLKPSCQCIRPVIFALLLAVFGLAFMPPPVMADIGPEYYVNPNMNEPSEDHPWADYSDGQTLRSGIGSCYMYVQIAYWLVDSGIIDVGQDLKAQSTGSGNRERNTADETEYIPEVK